MDEMDMSTLRGQVKVFDMNGFGLQVEFYMAVKTARNVVRFEGTQGAVEWKQYATVWRAEFEFHCERMADSKRVSA